MSQKGAVVRKDYCYVAPRLQVPPKPARPLLLYFAEGAETAGYPKRLLCPGQQITFSGVHYVVVTLFWIGSRGQGKNKWTPLPPFNVLLLHYPFPKDYDFSQVMDNHEYAIARVSDVLHKETPNPVTNNDVNQSLCKKMTEHSMVLV